MVRDQLKQKAQSISKVPSHYQLMIEDYGEKDEKERRAFFAWQDVEVPERDISVELDHHGRLINLTKEYEPVIEESLSEERLLQIALQFTEQHYPNSSYEFVFHEKKETEQFVRFTYVQTVLDLPLPQTGFYVKVAKNGEVMEFRYNGGTSSFSIPKQIAGKESVTADYLKHIQFELAVEKVRSELYEGGDDRPHLIYEADLPFFSYPADITEKRHMKPAAEDEDEEETLPLPVLPEADRQADIDDMIGFAPSMRKIRETDMGESIGTVWRLGNDPEPRDRSIAGYFEIRNQNTLKIVKDKKSGKLKGVASFIKSEGHLSLSEEDCLRRALQFLYKLYPGADQLFRMHPAENDGGRQNAFFQFDLQYKEVPLRLGSANITISRTTGRVVGYHGPEIEPEALADLSPSPSISEAEAKAVFAAAFDVKLQWERDYSREKDDFYRLVYRPVYPYFIDAHDGKAFMSKNM
ncbi:YcdB/YcdC domain-containing protein [Bacillus paralicheniformis]|uniref:YcdB/YcdC domain-containing protein n=1 Tax=Bacillus paralicheniformis TaxID=1648923 RepID=UPI0035F592BF